MNKDQFIHVLHHLGDSSAADAQQVLLLTADFPYSQMLHTLAARLSRDHGLSNQQHELQVAAVYASDRAVLKEIMTQSGTLSHPRILDNTNAVSTTVSYAASASTTPGTTRFEQQDDSIDLAEEVIHDLDRLHVLKHNFEMMFVDVPVRSTVDSPQSTVAQEKVIPAEPVVPVVKEPVKPVAAPVTTAATSGETTEGAPVKPKESSKVRKARIVELARQLAAEEAAQAAAESEEDKEGKPASTRKKKDQPGDHLIEEIRSSKQEIEPAGEKQKEQIAVIDQFIKQQPSITANNTREKLNAAPVGDLTTIKNGEFGDNIVSETLVEILLRQGKKDKAIEVLKKLIWKFPQKKTYFAAQIEELKK